MQTAIYAIIGILLLVIENLARVSAPVFGKAPQFTFLLIIFLGFVGHPTRIITLAFIFGYAVDALGGNLPGVNAVIFVICGSIMYGSRRNFYLRSIPFEILSILLMTTLAVLLKIGLLFLFSLGRGLALQLLGALPAQIALNLIAGLVMFPILFRIDAATDLNRRDTEIFSRRTW